MLWVAALISHSIVCCLAELQFTTNHHQNSKSPNNSDPMVELGDCQIDCGLQQIALDLKPLIQKYNKGLFKFTLNFTKDDIDFDTSQSDGGYYEDPDNWGYYRRYGREDREVCIPIRRKTYLP